MIEVLKKFLNRQSAGPIVQQRVEVMSGGPAVFTPFTGNAYESDIYRAAVDAIARNAAKLKPCHVILNGDSRLEGDAVLNRILQIRPNPYMSTYDFIYKTVTHYFIDNNAFAYIQTDTNGNLLGLYPLRPNYMEYLQAGNNLFCRFLFDGGKEYIFPFSDIFVLRRHFNNNDLLGDSNSAIMPALDLANTQS